MFSGIIESIGTIAAIDDRKGDKRITIEAAGLDLSDAGIGHSIAVNGVCLTVVTLNKHQFSVDVSAETLACTTFHHLKTGSRVNLEKALRFSDRIHGHLVAGHVDGTGTVHDRKPDARSERLEIECPSDLLRYIALKGSVTVDGVSLTVNAKTTTGFSVNIIPHTHEQTIIGSYVTGTPVNIEVDLVARYLESLLSNVNTNA